MTFVAGKLRANALNDLINQSSPYPLGIIGRARRETNSTTTTTEIGVLELDDILIYASRTYVIETSILSVDGSIANDVIATRMRYTTDGATPTTGSTQMAVSQTIQPNVSFFADAKIRVTYTPSANQTLSLLLTVGRATGTGSVGILGGATFPIEITVFDAGLEVGDTGVDI